MRLVIAALAALLLTPSVAAAADPQDFTGSWRPPDSTSVSYRITTKEESDVDGFVGRLTDGGIALAACAGAPDTGDPFWKAKQEGSLNGGGIYGGRTFVFRTEDDGSCSARSVRARFWVLAPDRLRICPNAFDAPEADPTMDLQSPVGESPNCTDFVRTEDPLEPKFHVPSDYIGKIYRDDSSCATDYNMTLRYVEDDPMINVKVFLKRAKGGFKFANNNQLFLPQKTDADRKRELEFRWVKKGPLTIKVIVRTESGKTYTRKRAFSPCKP